MDSVSKKNGTTNGQDTPEGVFAPGEMLTMDALRKRCGWGSWAVRQAKKDGLVVRRVGNTRFVLADDLIRFVTERGTVEN